MTGACRTRVRRSSRLAYRGVMSGWRRCVTCRKVRPAEDFGNEGEACLACLAGPAPRKRASPVVSSRTAARPSARAVAEPVSAPLPRLGSVGSGDLEVRERRARRAATEALVEGHAEEFELLLQSARRAEGLRAPS